MRYSVKSAVLIVVLIFGAFYSKIFHKSEGSISEGVFAGEWINSSKSAILGDESIDITRTLSISARGEVNLRVKRGNAITTYMGKIDNIKGRRAEVAILWGPVLEPKIKDATASRRFIIEMDHALLKLQFENQEEYLFKNSNNEF